MERKIGAFLSELRRENGLTQKELAGMLHVSDKTVSRWERDEGTPDLFLVPVLAKLYGITSDEIIAGERSIREENGQRLSSESIPCEEKQAGGNMERKQLSGIGRDASGEVGKKNSSAL